MRERFVRWLCRVCLRAFFARVEVAGLEKIPGDRPLIVVGNHQNSLIDPVLLIGFLPRYPKLLAKSTLWRVTFLRRLLALGGAIPVYRRQDSVDHTKNVDTFSRCHEEMFRGGTIALFPEGDLA